MKVLLEARRLATPDGFIEHPRVVMEEGRIAALGTRASLTAPGGAVVRDFGEGVLTPGLLDIHVHGGAGYDLMTGGAEGLRGVARHLARHGVTSFLPTTVSGEWAATLADIGRLAEAMAQPAVEDGARAWGLHLEGPFLSPRRRGVHAERDLLEPNLKRLEQLWEAAQGRIRLVTVAPELAGAGEFIAAATARGIRVSLGHSDATLAQARAGVAAGAVSVTHTFNAMPPLNHRAPGLVGEALGNAALYAEMIADGVHVDPLVVALFLALKGAERAILVSDGISAAGQGDGQFALGPLRVTVSGGRCLAGGKLAGSVLTLDAAVRNAMEFGGCGLWAAVRMASYHPARMLGIEGGDWNVGAAADVVAMTAAGEVVQSYVRGRAVL